MTNIHLIPAFRHHPPQDKQRLTAIVAECDDKKIPMISRIFGLEKERDQLLNVLGNLQAQIQQIEDGDRPYTGFDMELIDDAIAKAGGWS